MKKLWFLAALAVVITGFTSCGGDDPMPSPAFSVDPTTITLEGDATTTSFTIKCPGEWTASQSGVLKLTGLPLYDTGDQNITVTFDANSGAVPRTATVSIKYNGETLKVTITQKSSAYTNKPDAAGAIEGPNENTCPDQGVLLHIGEIPGAASYQWYYNGNLLKGETASTLFVASFLNTQSTFTVAGVNPLGEGEKSPAHIVTIKQCNQNTFTTDDLVGTWLVYESVSTPQEGDFHSTYTLSITKAGDGSLNVSGLLKGVSSVDAPDGLSLINIKADPGNGYVIFPCQKTNPNLYGVGDPYDSWFSVPTEERGEDISRYGVFGFPFRTQAGDLLMYILADPKVSMVAFDVAYSLNATNRGTANNQGVFLVSYQTVWTKQK